MCEVLEAENARQGVLELMSSLYISSPYLQGTTCLEKGAYLMNYVGCHQCQARASVGEKDQTKQEEENGDEVITFTRMWLLMLV